jgi:hypothetical protein
VFVNVSHLHPSLNFMGTPYDLYTLHMISDYYYMFLAVML